MNAESAKENLFSVVLLDGREKDDVNFDTIKEWYFKRQINESSLIFSREVGRWQMLKKVFNLDDLKAESSSAGQTEFRALETSHNPPFQPAANASSTLPESFPTTSKFNPNYGIHTTENYEARQPPRQATATSFNNAFANRRAGFRAASIFLIANSFVWFISLFVTFTASSELIGQTDGNIKFGQMVGRDLIRLFIDLYLANRLWNAADGDDSSRIFTIVRTYFGSIFFLSYVYIFFSGGFYFAGFAALGSIIFYALALLIVLHGKDSPAPSRIKIGWASFVFFVLFSVASMFSTATIVSDSGKNARALADMKKYELPSNVFADSQTPVKITLPAGWKQYSPQTPSMTSAHARMIAMDAASERAAKLTVHPFAKQLDIDKSKLTTTLDEALKITEPELKAENPSYRTILSSTIYLGEKPAKRVIFERTSAESGRKIKGHIILTMDNSNAYVLEMWCGADDYTNAAGDFSRLETNFSVR